MTKKWFYLVAALALTGCAQDAFDDGTSKDAEVPQEIKLSAGSRGIEVASRGKGSVGTGTNEDQWNGETIKIYAFNKKLNDSQTSTEFNVTTPSEDNVYLNGVSATVGTDVNQSPVTFEGGAKYFPLQGAYHFVGYHADGVDGAATGGNTITIPVTITGKEDIMIAKATMNYSDKENLVNDMISKGKLGSSTSATSSAFIEPTTGNPIAGTGYEDDINAEYEKAYSSYTARRAVQPNMVFEHQLVRLNFKVKAGDEHTIARTKTDGTANDNKLLGVYIKDIAVSSHATGNITISKDGGITFTDNSGTNATELHVGSKMSDGQIGTLVETGDGYDDNTNTTNTEPKQVGEGLLVMLPYLTAGEGENAYQYYTANIKAIQYYDNYGNQIPDAEQVKTYPNVKIQKPIFNNQVTEFEAGKSYDIIITVYSNQSISITATLTGWEEGGQIEINPEDEYFNQ